jgi:hypothetical protein
MTYFKEQVCRIDPTSTNIQLSDHIGNSSNKMLLDKTNIDEAIEHLLYIKHKLLSNGR